MLLDNKKTGKVGDKLKEVISDGTELSVISGLFSIYGFDALRKELSKVESIRLLFSEPSTSADETLPPLLQGISGDKFERRFQNKLNQTKIAKECAAWLSERAEVKAVNSAHTLSQNLFHIRNEKHSTAIQGSSHFTTSGLGYSESDNYAMNTCLQDADSTTFDTPKPIKLIKKMLGLADQKEAIILDFFGGSCATAHAVFEFNIEDNGNRKFIMVQLPELCEEKSSAAKGGFKTIAEIGKERIRRAADIIKQKNSEYAGDLGFKVFKLDSSNIRAWDPDRNDLEGTLLKHTEHLVHGRSEEDILYELLLKRGVQLTVPIQQKNIAGKNLYSIGYGVLFACLDTKINTDEVEDLASGICIWHKELDTAGDTQVVFRDSAFSNDVAKTNMTAILQQNGISHVRSL